MKGLAELVKLIPTRNRKINTVSDLVEGKQNVFVVITHEDSQRTIHTKFVYSEKHFDRFVGILDTLHDRKCTIVKSTLEEFEDYPDLFSDEKLEISIDEELGEYSNKI